jgi:hypothetical protein
MLLHDLMKVEFLQLEVSGVLWLILTVSLTLPSLVEEHGHRRDYRGDTTGDDYMEKLNLPEDTLIGVRE